MKKNRNIRRRLSGWLLGLLAAALAVAVVAVGDAVESRAAGQIDLSFNRITTQSAATLNVLHGLQRDVHAYSVASQGNELKDLSALLNRYQAATPHFTWSSENLSRNPLLLQWVSDDVNDSAVTTDCLILRCEETGRTRVLTWEDYMGFGYSSESGLYALTGLTYEKAITEAILYVTTDELPRVQLLQGHGELTESETAALEQKLRSANYEVSRVNLRRGDTLAPDAPLMILSPVQDLAEAELEPLTAFVRGGGSLFVTVDFTDPEELPNLYAFYRLYGVHPLTGLVLADEKDRGSYYSSVAELTPTLLSVEGVTDAMVQTGADYILMAPARALELVRNTSADLLFSPLLQSGEGSYLHTLRGNSADLARVEDDPAGPFTLAVLCDRGFEDGTRSRAFFCGNSAMFLDDTLYSMTYSGEMLLQVMQRLQGRAPLNLDILAREAVRPQLDAQGSLAPVVMLTLPPLMIAILAVAVLLPRKYL